MGWTRLFDPLNLTGLDSSAKDEANAQAQQYMAQAPRPEDVTYNSIFNPATQGLGSQASQMLAGNNIDQAGLNKFQGEAMRSGPSEWARRAGQEQNFLAMNAKEQGAKTVAGQGAAARSSLASRGGLSGGAAERIAGGAADNYLNMTQGVNNTLAGNDMQIGQNDEQNRISMLGQVPGMQLGVANFGLDKTKAQLQANSTDVANEMQDAQQRNTFNLGQYQTKMAGWGAGQTAATTANAGKHKK